jgi:DNA-binding MarR family transcriptional regulator
MTSDEERKYNYNIHEDRDTRSIQFDTRGDKNFLFSTAEHHKEELTEAAEELGMARSAAIRHWIEIGRRSMIENDPRNKPEQKSESNPIRDLIPKGEDNAVDIRDELPQLIEDALIDIVDEDEEITRDGFDVYL